MCKDVSDISFIIPLWSVGHKWYIPWLLITKQLKLCCHLPAFWWPLDTLIQEQFGHRSSALWYQDWNTVDGRCSTGKSNGSLVSTRQSITSLRACTHTQYYVDSINHTLLSSTLMWNTLLFLSISLMLSLLSMQALAAKDYVGVQSIARDTQKFSAVSIVSVSKWKMEIWTTQIVGLDKTEHDFFQNSNPCLCKVVVCLPQSKMSCQ